MDREWLTLRLLQIDIAVVVVIVLVGIAAITARLARDPSESVVRWWQERGRTSASVAQQPAGLLAREAKVASAASAGQGKDSHLHTPEWLDRLIGRHQQDELRPAGEFPVHQEAAPGRRVA